MAARHVTALLDAATLAEIRAEARRLDRSVSWLMQRVYRLAAAEIRRIPTQAPPLPRGRSTALQRQLVAATDKALAAAGIALGPPPEVTSPDSSALTREETTP